LFDGRASKVRQSRERITHDGKSLEEEVLKNPAEHAKQREIREVTPELKAKVKAAIQDEK